jgi:hypothetical protein
VIPTATLKLNVAPPVSGGAELSVAVTVNETVPAVVGVPVTVTEVPGDPLKPNQLGASGLIANVYGAVPPAAVQLAPVYATPTCAVAGKMHVIPTATFMLKLALPMSGVAELSVAVTVNETVPAVVGVPVMVTEVPGDPLKPNQLGPPGLIANVYGAVPPVALQLPPVNVTPTWGVAGKVHVIPRATFTIKLALPVAGGAELSIAVTVNENVPATVGVPVVVTEVPGDPLKPNQLDASPLIANVYGAVPPVALQLPAVYATPTTAPGRLQKTVT